MDLILGARDVVDSLMYQHIVFWLTAEMLLSEYAPFAEFICSIFFNLVNEKGHQIRTKYLIIAMLN